jgi:hypothetical protein
MDMWINFRNLCMEDATEVFSGDEVRKSMQLLVEPRSIVMIETKFSKTPAWVVKVETRSNYDPKVHFTDEMKAKMFYTMLCNLVVSTSEYEEIDVQVHGAI